jgi:hypothetical protein
MLCELKAALRDWIRDSPGRSVVTDIRANSCNSWQYDSMIRLANGGAAQGKDLLGE